MADAQKEVKVVISGDSSSAESALSRIGEVAAGLGLERIAESVLNIGKEFITSSVAAYNESERVNTQLATVLKSTAGVAGITKDAAVNLSKALESQTTFSDEAVLSAENLLLTFTKIGTDTFPQATQTVLDMSVALGEDTKSAAIQLGKALQDPILGITALRRVGVNFNDDQKKVIEGLVNTGHQLEAQKMILKELNTEFGGSAAAAATTFQGKMDQLKNTFDDVQEVIGRLIVGAIYPFVSALKPLLDVILQLVEGKVSLGLAVQQLQTKFPQLAGAIDGLYKFIILLRAELQLFLTPILNQLQIIWEKHHVIITQLATAFAIVLGAAVMAIVALLGTMILVSLTLGEKMYSLLEGIRDLAIKAFDFLAPKVETLGKAFSALATNVVGVMSSIVSSVKSMVNGAIDEINKLINAINNVASKMPGGIKLPTIANAKEVGGIASGLTLVGEHGPELVDLPGGSYVHSAAESRGAATSNVSVVINNPTVRSNRDIDQIVDQITRALGRNNELARLGVI